jgi:hypothetical protein
VTGRTSRHLAAWAFLLVGSLGLVIPVVPAGASATPPKSWDPRIREFVKVVERERGLRFDHPIPVEFLDDQAFERRVLADEQDLTKQDRKLGKQYSGDLYAVGLVEPGFDYNATSSALDAAGVVGFYDQDTKKMVVRGTDLTDTDVRVTIVHELTHALQDQKFGLTELQDATGSSGAEFALTALIEGDATWVEEAYVASLPQAEQDAYYANRGTGGEEPEVAPVAGALVLDALSSAPYELGYWFVDYLRRGGSTARLDRTFRRPPPSDEQVIDPVALVKHERPDAPPAPKLRAGERRRGAPDELGVLTLAMLLGSRLDSRTALAAVTGWKGDTSVGFTRGDRPCVRASIATDNRSEGTELADALEAWAAKGPAGAASVERRGAGVVLDSCGAPDAALPTQDALSAMFEALSARYLNYEDFSSNRGLTPRDLRCLADFFSTDHELMQLYDTVAPDAITDAQQALIDERGRAYAKQCGLVTQAR